MYAKEFFEVGRNIQDKLNEKGMTQQNLADELSISKQVMSKIIKGNKAINVNEIGKIADVLGTTAEDLLTVSAESAAADVVSFMGNVRDEEGREKINLIRTAIDEIHLLEELLYG